MAAVEVEVEVVVGAVEVGEGAEEALDSRVPVVAVADSQIFWVSKPISVIAFFLTKKTP